MEWLLIIAVLAAIALFLRIYLSKRNTLLPGEPAPDFTLVDQNGDTHSLADFKGKWLALYFYPKDDTPGCTRQACAFQDDLQQLKASGAEVIGVSVDSVNSHHDFAHKFGLRFPLLADTTAEVSARYHSLFNLGLVKFAQRNTFLIDPFGKIAKVYLSASAAHNSNQIVADLKQLQEAQ